MRPKHFFMQDQAHSSVDSFMYECPEFVDASNVSDHFSGTGLAVVVAVLTLLNLLVVVPGT
jgi:hypothetical protein